MFGNGHGQKGWVLVTADGPQLRAALATVRALGQAGYRVGLAVSCGSSMAEASKYCLRRVEVPRCPDPGYKQAIRDAVELGGYLTVLPATEAACQALGVGGPDLLDKTCLYQRAAEAGIPTPPTRVFGARDELLAAARDLDYPAVVKPAIKTYNAIRVESPDGLARLDVPNGPVMVQPFLSHMNAVSGVIWKGTLVAAVHEQWFRLWNYHCGVASAAMSVPPDENREAQLVRTLDGYEGLFQAQFAGQHLLDVNLFACTTHPLAVAAGVNLVGIYCDLLRGEPIGVLRGAPGVSYRWLEGDVRHLARAIREGDKSFGSALLALRPHFGAAHSTESLSDPGPMLNRIGYIARAAAKRTVLPRLRPT